jgi:membrane protease YdiL (CAAX protease family)
MNDQPILLLVMTATGLYAMNLWRHDYLAQRVGQPNRSAMPGTTQAPLRASVIAATGALIILAAETWGEIRLGLSEQQSKITVLFGVYTLIAAFLEELLFRGFLVIEGKGKAWLWAGIVGASVIFAAIHPFLWNWEGDAFEWTFTAKGWFSTIVVFVSSLWFYSVRFATFNPQHSLIPCIVAHATKNLGVIIIKATSGFVVGWY